MKRLEMNSMANTRNKAEKDRVKVGKIPARSKKLTTKEARKVKGGIIAVLIGLKAENATNSAKPYLEQDNIYKVAN